MDGFSDRGSTPLRSTNLISVRKSENAVFMQVFALFVFFKKVVFVSLNNYKIDVLMCHSETWNQMEEQTKVKNLAYGIGTKDRTKTRERNKSTTKKKTFLS